MYIHDTANLDQICVSHIVIWVSVLHRVIFLTYDGHYATSIEKTMRRGSEVNSTYIFIVYIVC